MCRAARLPPIPALRWRIHSSDRRMVSSSCRCASVHLMTNESAARERGRPEGGGGAAVGTGLGCSAALQAPGASCSAVDGGRLVDGRGGPLAGARAANGSPAKEKENELESRPASPAFGSVGCGWEVTACGMENPLSGMAVAGRRAEPDEGRCGIVASLLAGAGAGAAVGAGAGGISVVSPTSKVQKN